MGVLVLHACSVDNSNTELFRNAASSESSCRPRNKQASKTALCLAETAKETEGGRTYYDAEVRKSDSEKVEIKVAEDGTLISIGKEEEDND